MSNLSERNEHLLMNETTVENMTTIGTVYESMMRNQRTYLANQDNKHRLEDECTDFSLNTSRNGVGEVSKRSRSKSKFSFKSSLKITKWDFEIGGFSFWASVGISAGKKLLGKPNDLIIGKPLRSRIRR